MYEQITISKDEYTALREIARAAYEYANVFYNGVELTATAMQNARRKLMRVLDLDSELVEKFRGY